MLPALLLFLNLGAMAVAQLPSIPGVCPSEADRQILFPETAPLPAGLVETCGQGDWREVARLNMTDPDEECPSPWTERTISSLRLCGSSSTVVIPVDFSYTRVCGRMTGYVDGDARAFTPGTGGDTVSLESNYVDGVDITYNQTGQLSLVWVFAADTITSAPTCPCDNSNTAEAPLPPVFVGNNKFCDTLSNELLWDGQDCNTDCCTFNSPPWFNSTLASTISENLRITIMADFSDDDPLILVQQYQIFVA